MTRIDRYLLVLYMRVLLICFACITGLLIVVHFFTNMDEFVRFSERQSGGIGRVLVEYYAPYTIWIFEKLSGFLVLLALLFAIAWLNRTNELTALVAAGVTKRRILRPLMIASILVIVGAAVTREIVIPMYQDRLDKNPQDLTGDSPRPMRPTYDSQAMSLLQGREILPINQEIVGPILNIQGGPLAPTVGGKIVATKAYHVRATGERPAGFLFKEVTTPRAIHSIASIYNPLSGTPILLTAADTDWIKADECFLVSTIEFEMLRGGSAWKQYASTQELIQHLKGEHSKSGNDVRVLIHQRLLRPFFDWTVLLLGIPLLFSRPDRHMFWVAGACIGIVAGFTGVAIGLAAMGSSNYLISPELSVWLPLLIFLPWGWAKTASALQT